MDFKSSSQYARSMTRRRILITNDDGVHAEGLRHLWSALQGLHEVVVVAPKYEQSGVGLAITIRDPLRVEKVNWDQPTEVWSVSGTPADCVKLALHTLKDFRPDLVVSGINRGSNAGRNAFYSGTVGGAIEGVMQGIPSIAFSCEEYDVPAYAAFARHIPSIVQHAIEHPLPSGTLLNVTYPCSHTSKLQGMKLARQGKGYWAESPSERQHPAEGHSYYWLGARTAQFDEHPESDVALLKQGYITAVPLQVAELTDHLHLQQRREQFEQLFSSQ